MQFTFIGEDGAETRLTEECGAGRVCAVAAYLRGRVPEGDAVGLLFRTGADLVVNWLACLQAGLRPLVMQYPTRKQSRAYWADSVANTVAVTGLRAIIADEHCADMGVPGVSLVIAQTVLRDLPEQTGTVRLPAQFEILQLSSGTTGHRKAMAFSSDALRRHAEDFNRTLRLGPDYRIVSWLPLYHDMGYIACFVMPLLLGIDVVMMDPIDWVRRPEMLFEAIERCSGTICYMPNFGFEVMSRVAARALPSMRRWISCSEPVSVETARKFLAHVGAGPDRFSPCYAMAENIFAISLGRGLKTEDLDHGPALSCGKPISGVQVKTYLGELWVRSPTSLAHYLDGLDIRDAAGYYPTGDLGEIVDGEVYVTGRKQDLLVQAGRKHFLSDIDLLVNRLLPEAAGRAAALALPDKRMGTEYPVVLVEAADFFSRTDQAALAAAIMQAGGPEQLEVAFVPPRFLTKTSSGKINRRMSAQDYQAVLDARNEGRASVRDHTSELGDMFQYADWNSPVGQSLDSLSLVMLRLLIGDAGLVYHPEQTLTEIRRAFKGVLNAPPPEAIAVADTIRIVSIADRPIWAGINESHIAALSQALGAPVTVDHVCLPCVPIVLSDLIFQEYFQPRLASEAFAAVNAAQAKLRGASLIVVDDVAEMAVGSVQAYGVLSHALERSRDADLVCFRWQPYARLHDELPLTAVSGADLPLDERTAGIDRLGAYLQTPIFRIASQRSLEPFTRGWEYRPLDDRPVRGERAAMLGALQKWALLRKDSLRKVPRRPGPSIDVAEPGHFCSNYARREAVDVLLDHFDRFCLVGPRASLPYVRNALERLGKFYVEVPSFAPAVLAAVTEPFDCMILRGAWGDDPIEGPAVAFQHIGSKGRSVFNLDWFEARFKMVWDHPKSGQDWFAPFEMIRHKNRDQRNELQKRLQADTPVP